MPTYDNAYYADQAQSAKEAEEVLRLLEQAGVNREQLAFVTGKLREEIDACGEPTSSVPLMGSSEVGQRRARLTARLNYLRSEAWRLPVPIGWDIPLEKIRLQERRSKAGSVSKADLWATARKAVRELAEQNSHRK